MEQVLAGVLGVSFQKLFRVPGIEAGLVLLLQLGALGINTLHGAHRVGATNSY